MAWPLPWGILFTKPNGKKVEIPMVMVEFETPQLHQDWTWQTTSIVSIDMI